MYKYFIWILCLVSIFVGFFYKQITLDARKFEKDWNTKIDIQNYYKKYFYLKNFNPLFIFKNEYLDKYVKWSFENNHSGLIYPQQQIVADLNYIKNIQYIASYIETYQAKYMYEIFNEITSLSPFWTPIYEIASILMPSRNYEKTDEKEKEKTRSDAIKIGEKGILFNCSKDKIEKILSLSDEEYLRLAYSKSGKFYEENSNPCKDAKIASALGFNYFYYLKDLKNTIKYYKIAGFDKNTLMGTIGMVSVANGILGENEKAIYLLIQKVINLQKNMKNASDKEYYEKQIISTIERAVDELNFYLLKKSDEETSQCEKDFQCLEKNGIIKNEIEKLKNYCIKEINLNNISNVEDIISNNTGKSIQNAKCFLYAYALTNGYIKENKLYSAIIKNGEYYYDKKLDRRWVKNPTK